MAGEAVSVIIPTYNRAHLVVRAIRSALAAMRTGDELIVVDDGSTDGTFEAMRGIHVSPDPRCQYVPIENSGPGAARNAGINRAARPLLAFLDSDDVWPVDSLELRRRALELVPEAVCAFGDLRIRRKDGSVQHDVLQSVHRHHPRVGSEGAPNLRGVLNPICVLNHEGEAFNAYVGDMEGPEKHAHWITCQTALVRRALAPRWRFPEDVRLLEDYEAFAQLSKRGLCAYLDTELAEMREDAETRLTDVEELRHLDARMRVIERVWGGCDILRSKLQLRRRIARGQRVRAALRTVRNAFFPSQKAAD